MHRFVCTAEDNETIWLAVTRWEYNKIRRTLVSEQAGIKCLEMVVQRKTPANFQMSLLVKAPNMSREHDKFTRLPSVRFVLMLLYTLGSPPHLPQKKEALPCIFDRVIVKILLFDKNLRGKNNVF